MPLVEQNQIGLSVARKPDTTLGTPAKTRGFRMENKSMKIAPISGGVSFKVTKSRSLNKSADTIGSTIDISGNDLDKHLKVNTFTFHTAKKNKGNNETRKEIAVIEENKKPDKPRRRPPPPVVVNFEKFLSPKPPPESILKRKIGEENKSENVPNTKRPKIQDPSDNQQIPELGNSPKTGSSSSSCSSFSSTLNTTKLEYHKSADGPGNSTEEKNTATKDSSKGNDVKASTPNYGPKFPPRPKSRPVPSRPVIPSIPLPHYGVPRPNTGAKIPVSLKKHSANEKVSTPSIGIKRPGAFRKPVAFRPPGTPGIRAIKPFEGISAIKKAQ
ncbi:hypothetical protein JL09_g5366 [Pichia kudriavzevii]|uniref:Uncharacterized protein n=1 Tax=Pichia kudriavzevii TaxID=4909 RepID=A0A099NU17_PICKU|nr:hypothetical protein JL09_g5366 [Pichia kudriavzevii]